jgi:hypothetical protein
MSTEIKEGAKKSGAQERMELKHQEEIKIHEHRNNEAKAKQDEEDG